MKLNQQQVQHLLLRAGFGDEYGKVKKYVGLDAEEILKSEFKLAGKIKKVKINANFPDYTEIKMMDESRKDDLRKEARQGVKTLNTHWITEMARASSAINEKMAFFWHDHFACRSTNPIFMQGYLDVIRDNALGNFSDLLRGISKSPAMLEYLNNQQNRKKAPNENFAREVMELFTLSRDEGYTEKDISEAARAFTGWGFDQSGAFVFRNRAHDAEQKTVFGKTGNFNGDDIISMLLENRRTANHIARKWILFFINKNGESGLEEKVAKALYDSKYDIKTGLTAMFTDKRFYNPSHIGARIKSPIELIVGMQRQLHVLIENPDSIVFLQRTLGQVLFDPPNVAGWPDGEEWIDSASLLFRLNLPQLVFKAAVIQHNSGESFDDNNQFNIRGKLKQLEAKIDLDGLKKTFDGQPKEALRSFLIQGEHPINEEPEDFLEQIVYLTSKPEYQLC